MTIDQSSWFTGWIIFDGTLTLFGTVFNFITIAAVLSDANLRKQSSNLFVCNLAFADFLYGAVLCPTWFNALRLGHIDSSTCYTMGIVSVVSCSASILFLTAI